MSSQLPAGECALALAIKDKGYYNSRMECAHEIEAIESDQLEDVVACYVCLVKRSQATGLHVDNWFDCVLCRKVFCFSCFSREIKGNNAIGNTISSSMPMINLANSSVNPGKILNPENGSILQERLKKNKLNLSLRESRIK